MFQKLSSKMKKIVVNSIIVLAIMLLIIGFYTGKKVEENEAKLEKEMQEQQELEEQKEGYSVSDLEERMVEENKREERQIANEVEDDIMHDDYEYADDPTADFDGNAEYENNRLIDIFTDEEIEQAKETALGFVTAYYEFNGDKPMQHIENAKEHVTSRLYDEIQTDIPPRPSDDYYSRLVKEIEIYETYSPKNEKELLLSARVEGEILNYKGKKSDDEQAEYKMSFILDENKNYKIDSFESKVIY